jgi:hypothetical protein
VGKLRDGGILPELARLADDHRGIGRREVDPTKQRLGLGVRLEIHPVERDQIAGGEVAKLVGRRGEARADDLDALVPRVDQHLAARDERPHDGLAHIGQLVHGPDQPGPIQVDDAAIGRGPGRHQRGPPRQSAHLAGELPGPDAGEPAGVGVGAVHHGDLALEHHEEAHAGVADGIEDFAGGNAPLPAPCGEGGQVMGGQDGKGEL